MEIVFKAKNLLDMVKGIEKHLVFPVATSPNTKLTVEKKTKVSDWKQKNAKARMLISSGVTQKILGKLTSSTTAASMWQQLQKLFPKKSPESIFTL